MKRFEGLLGFLESRGLSHFNVTDNRAVSTNEKTMLFHSPVHHSHCPLEQTLGFNISTDPRSNMRPLAISVAPWVVVCVVHVHFDAQQSKRHTLPSTHLTLTVYKLSHCPVSTGLVS